ncbi:MAG TPA: DUF3073 domain-containing protein [Streptomyces sp.]|nr:DUF3073 domain-containing protein [Streptomyces sp.]
MGRGRAKAKQTKVARQLKYNSGGTDLARLAEELGASTSSRQQPNGRRFEEDELDDPYAQYADLYNDDDEDDEDGDHSVDSRHSSSPSNHRRRA